MQLPTQIQRSHIEFSSILCVSFSSFSQLDLLVKCMHFTFQMSMSSLKHYTFSVYLCKALSLNQQFSSTGQSVQRVTRLTHPTPSDVYLTVISGPLDLLPPAGHSAAEVWSVFSHGAGLHIPALVKIYPPRKRKLFQYQFQNPISNHLENIIYTSSVIDFTDNNYSFRNSFSGAHNNNNKDAEEQYCWGKHWQPIKVHLEGSHTKI